MGLAIAFAVVWVVSPIASVVDAVLELVVSQIEWGPNWTYCCARSWEREKAARYSVKQQ